MPETVIKIPWSRFREFMSEEGVIDSFDTVVAVQAHIGDDLEVTIDKAEED